MSRAKYWCFTHNNYESEPTTLPRGAVYLVFGREVASTGTRHLQGFVAFDKRKRLSEVIRLLPGCHLSVARKVPDAIEYCKKDGDYDELGERSLVKVRHGQGHRTEIKELYEAIRGGTIDNKELREAFPNTCARYPRYVEAVLRDHITVPPVPEYELYDWQSNLLELLKQAPSDRDVVFVVDEAGGRGKSYFGKYLRAKEKALVLGSGKVSDMAHVLTRVIPPPRIIVLDVCRSKMATLQYSFLEECKNGYVFSPKYESCVFEFPIPHVVVFCNEAPDMTKLSADRYNIIRL